MIVTTNEEMRAVLSQVSGWPASDRIVLARKILETMGASPPRATRGYSAEAEDRYHSFPVTQESFFVCDPCRLFKLQLISKTFYYII